MEILGKVFDFLIEIILDVLPFRVVRQNEHGVFLRVGKFKKQVECGWVWKWPFFDEILLCKNMVTTLATDSQSITTLDEKNIIVSAIVKYKIANPKKFLLEVMDASDAISDITQGKIKQIMSEKTWAEAKNMMDADIKDLVVKECSEWGIKVMYVTIVNLSQSRVFKIYNSNEH